MFFGPAMHIFSRFTIVASTLKVFGDIRGSSTPQAEQARDPISHSISPTIDLVSWILTRFTFCIRALVSIERIRIDQRSLQSFTSSFDYLYRELFSSSSPHLRLFLLHEFLQLRSRRWRDKKCTTSRSFQASSSSCSSYPDFFVVQLSLLCQ